MFKDVPNTIDFIAQELTMLEFWDERNVFGELKKRRENAPRWSFVDGPITANNPMGVHHAWGRTYKDLYHRFKAMQGYQTRYQNGFDCQGLWVEVNVEREMGFKSKKDIETYGMDKFVNACKQTVLKYAATMTEQSIRLGYWMEWDDPEKLRMLEAKMAEDPIQTITIEGPNGPVTDTVEQMVGRLGLAELGGSYFTFSNENNYTIWAMLKQCFDRGWIYKGRDVMPWCARCDTGISQHEIVTDGYRELTHTSIFLRFPLRNRPDESLLVWTTTPWTLTSNVAAAVHPELTYVLIEHDGHRLWLSEGALENAIRGSYQVLSEKLGTELEGWTYDGPFDELPAQQTSGAAVQHRVVLWKEVGEAEGTGIVHTAPGCGAEDFELSKEHGLVVIAPLEAEGIYGEGFDWLTGRYVHTVADEIFENLKGKDVVYRLEDYTHRYPVCWRCEEELVFRLVDEWFISMGEPLDKPYEEVTAEEKEANLRYQIMEVVRNETTWYPSFGLARELDWLRNMHDWMISKKRYWGLALPIYECRECDHFHVVGSQDELKERAVEGWQEFEGHTPHRPWIDAVKIACPDCGTTISRIPDVGNPWLDAGIVSFSTMGYRTDRDNWEKWFPADLISESFPGQFRNWFYVLLTMSTVLERRAPFKNIFTYAMVCAEDGREMHKSWGNAIWFDDAAEEMGVDVMRWMYCAAKPEQNLLFGYKRADEVRRQFLIPFWNVYSFLTTYANVDGWKPEPGFWERGTQDTVENTLDRWILARLQDTVRGVTYGLETFETDRTCRIIEHFLDDLSNWYVRRSRRRFWKSEADTDKASAYRTLYNVIVTFARLLAPFVPFVTEAVYQNLVSSVEPNAPKSIHHTDWPQPEEALIDEGLIESMGTTRALVKAGLAARASANLKVRQPLSRAVIHLPDQMTVDVEMVALITDELNVKTVEFVESAEQLTSYSLLPDNRKLGPRMGKYLRAIRELFAEMDAEQTGTILHQIERGESFSLELENETVEIASDEVHVQQKQPEGLAVVTESGMTVAVDTQLTPELLSEGLAREVVRRIQNLRKEADFNLDDRITTTYETDETLAQVFSDWREFIADETLSHELRAVPPEADAVQNEDNIDGHSLRLGVRHVEASAK